VTFNLIFEASKPPTVLFKHENGNISQSADGNLVNKTILLCEIIDWA